MALLDDIKKKVPAEIFTQFVDALGDDFNWDYVPRTRLNSVIAQRNELRTKLESLSSGESDEDDDNKSSAKAAPKAKSKSEDKDTTPDPVDVEAEVSKRVEAEVNKVKLQFAVTEKLREESVKDPTLMVPHLDMEKITFDDKGELAGLTEQLEPWKEKAPYLFGSDDNTAAGTGATGKGGSEVTLETLQTQWEEATKAGDMTTAISLKNKMYELQNTSKG